ncbi:MAG: hypothetical protein H8E15_07215 [Planctomycetes bacterium]|nr:hypothetical protein [Planctomycetota bacterium]
MTLLATTFPGIAAQSPELLIPLLIIAGAFGLSGLIGLGISMKDAIFRRN